MKKQPDQPSADNLLEENSSLERLSDQQPASPASEHLTIENLQAWWRRGLGGVTALAKPLQERVKSASRWFQVDEAELTEILNKVRAELPTTQVLLIGKPQTGKSSIIRGLTGVSADIVGQGFRPHTSHTQRYNYPTGDLPLLIFTDTVGLGEKAQETAAVIQELANELQPSSSNGGLSCPKVLIITVKITDFATEALRQIVSEVRQRHPEVPCLLAVTCLHELYPPEIVEHSAYPPDNSQVQRAFTAIQQGFAGLFDQAVLIDFTLEEDGYTPVFYGVEAFVEALATLLPAAASRMIHQLLTDVDAGAEISNLYREAGRRYIAPFAIMAGTLAAVPLPFATMPMLTVLQSSLVGLLGQLYGQVLTPSQAGGVVSAIAGGFVSQLIGRELVKVIPGLGSVVAASWAAAYTWALGEGACVYFGDIMGGKTPDPDKIKQTMDDAFQSAQARFKDAVWSPSKSSN